MESKPCATCQAPIEQSRTYCGTACRIEGLRRRNQATTKHDPRFVEVVTDDGMTVTAKDVGYEPDWRRPAGPREAMESWHRKPMNHGR